MMQTCYSRDGSPTRLEANSMLLYHLVWLRILQEKDDSDDSVRHYSTLNTLNTLRYTSTVECVLTQSDR
jgi:hypothetical protein